MATVQLQPLPPEEALAAFRKRGATLSPSFAWQDVWQAEHAKAFTVAKSAGFDILADIHGSLQEAMEKGETFESWSKRIRPTLADKGWWGRKEVIDPATGEVVEAQLGSTRRLQIIYDTNLRTSHAAGRWAQIERTAARRPWLRYVAVQDERTRQQHRRWHGTVLRWDDPWWNTHAPPNGWRCRCTVQQLSDRDLGRYGYTPSERAPSEAEPPRAYTNPRTGEVTEVPPGIDPGWAYNPGRAAAPATEALSKLATVPPAVAARAHQANPQLLPAALEEHRRWVEELAAEMAAAQPRPRHVHRAVGVIPPTVLDGLTKQLKGEPASALITLFDDDAFHWLRDAKAGARTKSGLPKALTATDLMRLPEILAKPEGVYWDTQSEALAFAFAAADPRHGKVVVLVDQVRKVRGADGARVKEIFNTVRTGGYERPETLGSARYVRLDKK